MILKIGNLFESLGCCDILLITANSVIKNNDALVMGAGIAKIIRDKIPNIDIRLGSLVKNFCGSLGEYNILFDSEISELGIFQTKYHFSDKSDLLLIKRSTDALNELSLKIPEKRIFLNYPGINHGRLTEQEVFPIICKLPNNVYIWKN